MLNLDNILKEILLEEVSPSEIDASIDNKERVLVIYDDDKTHHDGKRIVEPYVHMRLKNGEEAVRVFFIKGDTNTSSPKWETYLLDRIKSWEPTGGHFNRPPKEQGWKVQDYNRDGDKSASIIYNQVKFNDEDMNDSLANAKLDLANAKAERGFNVNDVKNLASIVQRNLALRDKELKDKKVKQGDELRQIFQPNSRLNTTYSPFDKETKKELQRLNRNKKQRDRYFNVTRPEREIGLADKGPIRSKESKSSVDGPVDIDNMPNASQIQNNNFNDEKDNK